MNILPWLLQGVTYVSAEMTSTFHSFDNSMLPINIKLQQIIDFDLRFSQKLFYP